VESSGILIGRFPKALGERHEPRFPIL